MKGVDLRHDAAHPRRSHNDIFDEDSGIGVAELKSVDSCRGVELRGELLTAYRRPRKSIHLTDIAKGIAKLCSGISCRHKCLPMGSECQLRK
ncbi:hypothetical protein Q1695_000557 [Nippostrongylus brasiliensis]|nr:hypothetical protein Q1695_000557 [Nippostrongylus brasiliensis]